MLILLAILAAGAAYLHVLTLRVAHEQPTYREEVARTRLNVAALEPGGAANQTATLYFPSFEQGLLVGETRQLAWGETEANRIRQVLLALIEGSHAGHGRSLPASATIRAVFLTPDGTAYLDFAGDWLVDLSPGITSECLAVHSIVNSLAANISTVKRVKILIQGREVETLDGHADLTDFFVPDPTRIVPGS